VRKGSVPLEVEGHPDKGFLGQLLVFTMILAISGVGFFFYIFSIIGDIIATSTLQIFSGKRMEGQIAKLKDHCILCGFGRVGKHVYEFLSPERGCSKNPNPLTQKGISSKI
jgi:hypothetical protein